MLGLLAADAQDARARQLLGQRAAALPCLARLQVDPGRAQHAGQVDAVVVGEVAVLHRLQAGDQQLRYVLDPHQLALFLRSEEHTSELQSLLPNSYAVLCLKKKKQKIEKDIIPLSLDKHTLNNAAKHDRL